MIGLRTVIFWGTKVRTRFHGVRAEYCGGCLCVTKHRVSSIERAPHLYNVSLGYRELTRFSECPLCGTTLQTAPDVVTVSDESAGGQSIEDLIQATNPALTSQRLQELYASSRVASPDNREAKVLQTFCLNQIAEFEVASHNLSGWYPLVLILILILTGYAIAYAGFVPGIAAGTALLVCAQAIRRKVIDAAVAGKVLPRLRPFLRANNRDIAYLEQWLKPLDGRGYRRFRRHLQSSCYEELRLLAAGLDAEPISPFAEYIVAEQWSDAPTSRSQHQ